MFTLSQHIKNKYKVDIDQTAIGHLPLSRGSLLETALNLLQVRTTSATVGKQLIRALHLAIDNLTDPFIHNLLLEPSQNVSINDVITGYKKFERLLIAFNTTSGLNSQSSAFRSLLADTKFKLSDGSLIGLCGFSTSFRKGSLPPTKSSSALSDIHAIKIRGDNSKNTYVIFDPDALSGLIYPKSLLTLSLQKYARVAQNEPIQDVGPQFLLQTLQLVAAADDNDDIKKLLTSPPSSIYAIDVLRGFTQLEDIIQATNVNQPRSKSAKLRSFLRYGGEIASGLNVNACEFYTRFLTGDKINSKVHMIDLLNVVPVLSNKTNVGKVCHFIDGSYCRGHTDAFLRSALHNLSSRSIERPIQYPKPLSIHRVLKALFAEADIEERCSFLFANPDIVTDDDIMQGSIAAKEILDRQKTLPPPRVLFAMLSEFSELGDRINTVHKQIKKLKKEEIHIETAKRASTIKLTDKKVADKTSLYTSIVHPESPEMQVFIKSGGLLDTCFTAAKWDVLCRESLSSEQYHFRISASRALRLLAQQANIPYTRTLLTSPPRLITPRTLYSAFKEIEAILPDGKSGAEMSRALRGFIERNIGSISQGYQVSSLLFRTRFAKRYTSQIIPYNQDGLFSLQKVNSNGTAKFFPFDPDRLSGLMASGGLLSKCLLASQSKPMGQSKASNLLNILEHIAGSNASSLKALLKAKPASITQGMALDGLIEFESLLERQGGSDQKSSLFRGFLAQWAGPIADAEHFNTLSFLTRFNSQGKVKCIPPVTLPVINSDGQPLTIKFDTYRAPDLYLKRGMLAESLLAVKKQAKTKPFPMAKVEQWCALIEHLISKLRVSSRGQGMLSFLSTPLGESARQKVIIGLKAIENLIELRSNCDHEADFFAIMSLLSLNSGKISDGRMLSEVGFTSRFSPVPSRTIVQFRVRDKHNGKPRIGLLDFDISDFESWALPSGLLMIAIKRAVKESRVTPAFRTSLNNVTRTIELIHETLNASVMPIEEHKANLPLHHLLTSPPIQLTKRDVTLGLKRLEDILERTKTKSARRSNVFRSFLNTNGGTISTGMTVGQCNFKTRFSERKERSDNELITPVCKSGKLMKSPIMQAHTSTQQLKKEINEFYQKPIDAITDACQKEIEIFQSMRNEMEPLVKRCNDSFSYSVPVTVQDFARQSAANKDLFRYSDTEKVINKFTRETVLAAFLQLRAETPSDQQVYCNGKSLLISSEYKCWYPRTGIGMRHLFWGPFLLPRQILLVCFIRLMIHTTWNKDVIATLMHEDLPYPLPSGSFFIQGRKNKVSKTTKAVEVTPADREVRQAIELLGKHHANMIRLGHSPRTVWDTLWSNSLSFLNHDSRDAFIERYGLPKFTIEQLAKHMIKVREGIDGDIRRSQAERKHSHIKTTAGYVDHPLARVFHDANNAEFQRRLETTVQLRYDGVKSLPEYGLSKSNIDMKLLEIPKRPTDTPHWFVLPDGSTCKDIWAAVDKASKNQSLCSGRKCHSGDGGCPHNIVIIGPDEFVNTLRKQRWFIERCDALVLKYTREYFDEYIAPEMRFVFGLVRYVEAAEPEFYQQAEQLLDTTIGGCK